MRTRHATALALVLSLLIPEGLSGQAVPRSQRGIVSQTVASTKITVIYNRPSARGRRLFGGVVRFGDVWNPGADDATTLTVSKDVRIAGRPLAAGQYSLWVVPAERGDWTLIFSRAAHVFHVPYPRGQDALRVSLAPERGAFIETLAFYFPVVAADSAVLRLHWGDTVLPIPIAVAKAAR